MYKWSRFLNIDSKYSETKENHLKMIEEALCKTSEKHLQWKHSNKESLRFHTGNELKEEESLPTIKSSVR